MKTCTLRTLPPALLLLAMAGCSGLLTSEQPPRQVYLLQPSTAAQADGARDVVLQLSIDVIPGLDTDRIVALDPDARIVPYANARWPEHLPEVLQSVLRRSLDATGRFERIESSDLAAPGQWQLELELQAFHGTLDDTGVTHSVEAALVGRIACAGGSHRLRLTGSIPVSKNRLSSVVAAHQAALDAMTRQLTDALQRDCGSS